MIIKIKRKIHKIDEPIIHDGHKRPVTRREFLGAGLITGSGLVMGDALLMGLMSNPAHAATLEQCGLTSRGARKIPFIAFDLGGGANMAGSSVLIGGPGGQKDFLSTAGYNKLGLPGDMIPGATEAAPATPGSVDHVNETFGLAQHSDSAYLRGMLAVTSANTQLNTNGFVIPARSDNDTGNNPHNPMYGINKAGADGELLTLIGSRASVSGGRSMAPARLIDLQKQPTKIDRASDVTGLVDTGGLVGLLSETDAAIVMDSVERLSKAKLGLDGGTGSINTSDVVKDLIHCGYLSTAANVRQFGSPAALDINQDADITNMLSGVSVDGIAPSLNDGYFEKVASVMKLCIDGQFGGLAGAGTIEQGGYDYHNGTRATGEMRDLRAGIGIGMCLEYAARKGRPVMIYVFSDGSLASNGRIDTTAAGRDKCEWTGDNSSTAASWVFVYNPGGRPQLLGGTPEEQAMHQQLGHMRASASVETAGTTPGANNVNLLVEMIVLNYIALHTPGAGGPSYNSDLDAALTAALGNHGLGSNLERLVAFQGIVNGTIS